jgi:hypothetical protein
MPHLLLFGLFVGAELLEPLTSSLSEATMLDHVTIGTLASSDSFDATISENLCNVFFLSS